MASLIRLDNGQIFNISNKIDIIGRGSSATIFLDDDGVSRNHCEIFMMSGCVEVIDLNSRNGIFVNSKKVKKSFLNDGDKLSVGSVDMVFSNESLESNKTISMKMQTTSSHPIAQSSASGRMEIIQLRINDNYLKSGHTTLSAPYLEQMFTASLDFNRHKGSRRISEVAINLIQKLLSPDILFVNLIDEELMIEKPSGAQAGIPSQMFENAIKTGTAVLRRKNAATDSTSVICSPIIDATKHSIGAIFIESQDKNYEIEDLLFVRALLASAAGATEDENLETTFLPPDIASAATQSSSAIKFDPEDLLILGSSDAVKHLKTRIGDLSIDKCIMISGPPGTNRNVIANNIHCMGDHSELPFVNVDCSALNPAVLQEELFGRKGGLPEGKFRQAKGGTLFLNRVTCLPLEIQEQISLYIQTGSILPMGATEAQKLDLQLVLGVRGRPERAAQGKVLSETLLQQFIGKRLHIPLLADRRDDVPEIADYYFQRYLKKYNKKGMVIAPQTMEKLVNYKWPGNDREMQLILERAILCCDHINLTPEYLALPGL